MGERLVRQLKQSACKHAVRLFQQQCPLQASRETFAVYVEVNRRATRHAHNCALLCSLLADPPRLLEAGSPGSSDASTLQRVCCRCRLEEDHPHEACSTTGCILQLTKVQCINSSVCVAAQLQYPAWLPATALCCTMSIRMNVSLAARCWLCTHQCQGFIMSGQ
jgi:hypothetical protein